MRHGNKYHVFLIFLVDVLSLAQIADVNALAGAEVSAGPAWAAVERAPNAFGQKAKDSIDCLEGRGVKRGNT